MRLKRTILPALVLTLGFAPVGHAFQDPFQALRQYDYQNRQALDAITRQIQAAGTDRGKQATIETGLIGVLQDPQATLGAKQEACRFLWEMGSGRSVPALAALLKEPATANMARYALERNSDSAAGAALRGALGSARGVELIGIINSIGNRGDEQAVPTLRTLAAGSDTAVADAAVTALGKIGTSSAIVALRNLPRPTALVHVAVLQATDKIAAAGKRAEAIGYYEGMTRPTFAEVVRAGALTGLAALGAPKTAEVAIATATSAPEPTLQRVAGRVLGLLTAGGDVRAAVAAWPRLPVPAQVALLTAWGDRRESAAGTLAGSALKSTDADVRSAAIQTLSLVGGPAAVPSLAELASGGEHAGRAREILARMGGTGVESALLRLAGEGPEPQRVAVITVLGQRPTPASTLALVKIAEGTNVPTATAALKVLSRTGTLEQEAPLVAVLVKTGDEGVREAAQRAIVAIAQRAGDPNRAASPLLAAMDRASVSGKAAIVTALVEVGGDQALDVVTRAASSSELELKNAAVTGLAETWTDPNGLPVLLKLAKEEPTKGDRVRALRGYLRLVGASDRIPAEQKLAQVTEALKLAERPEEKRQALSVVRDVRLPGALSLAASALDTPELAAEAADTILYLAVAQRKERTMLPAVEGAQRKAALEKVVQRAPDEAVRAQARKLLQ